VSDRPAALVALLGLSPHPEGGYYGEVFRSTARVAADDGRGARRAVTTIYFLLPQGAVSRWHRIRSDEVWHFYEGEPLDLWIASPEGTLVRQYRLGPLDGEQSPVQTVPGGHWQAARPRGRYSLVGCTVAPGFEFQDFTLLGEEPEVEAALRTGYPALSELL
jgi:predicted cupin superfamily sugar epimerase